MPRPTLTSPLLLTLAALALVASGCGSTDDTRPLTAAPPHPPKAAHAARDGHQQAPAATPTASAHRSTGTKAKAPAAAQAPAGRRPVAGSHPAARTSPLEAHLLTAAQVPALTRGTDRSGWTLGATGPEDSVSVGACQKTSLETIGAVTAVRRTFTPAGDARGTATQVVARFADRKSAWRAHEVLRSWHEDCEAEVGPLRTVEVGAGTGENYRVRYAATGPARARLAAFGIVAHGAYLSVVEITAVRRDFPADKAPARVAVRRISRSFA